MLVIASRLAFLRDERLDQTQTIQFMTSPLSTLAIALFIVAIIN